MFERIFEGMGGKRIYDDAVDMTVTRPAPISLSPAEVGAERVPEVDEPLDVVAWVRFPETPIRVNAKAIAWTKRAVWVEFTMQDGRTRRAWVWASAVSRPGEDGPPPTVGPKREKPPAR